MGGSAVRQAGSGDPRPMPSARAITRALRPLSRAGVDTAGLGKRRVYRTVVAVDLETFSRRPDQCLRCEPIPLCSVHTAVAILRVTRGPDAFRMTSALVVRGEP